VRWCGTPGVGVRVFKTRRPPARRSGSVRVVVRWCVCGEFAAEKWQEWCRAVRPFERPVGRTAREIQAPEAVLP